MDAPTETGIQKICMDVFVFSFPLFTANKNPSAAEMEIEIQLRWKEEPGLQDESFRHTT